MHDYNFFFFVRLLGRLAGSPLRFTSQRKNLPAFGEEHVFILDSLLNREKVTVKYITLLGFVRRRLTLMDGRRNVFKKIVMSNYCPQIDMTQTFTGTINCDFILEIACHNYFSQE